MNDRPVAVTVNPGSSVPAFEQVRSQISDRIRSGQLPGGERLPSIRQLAGDLRVAPGTVARAYRELESDGLLVSSRTHGTRVQPDQAVDQLVDADVLGAATRFVATARRSSVDLSDALALLRSEWTRSM